MPQWNIPGCEKWQTIEEVDKGWSGERKFRIFSSEFPYPLLLRLAEGGQWARKQAEYALLRQLDGLPLRISRPLAVGLCDEQRQVYSLYRWLEGEDAETALPLLSLQEQARLGEEAGETLRLLHQLPAPAEQPPWDARFSAKIDQRIARARACPISIPHIEQTIALVKAGKSLLRGRPQCFQHGDYHIGNMLLTPDAHLAVIDFNRFDFGDPWEEFNRLGWSVAASPLFARHMLLSYFEGDVPEAFFPLLRVYMLSNLVSSIPWAIPFGAAEVAVMRGQFLDVYAWYEDFSRVVPRWFEEAAQ